MNSSIKGFTLIELMITLFIALFLTSIAYSYYTQHLLKSHRSDALTALLSDQILLEHCYAQNFSYTHSCNSLPTFPHPSTQRFYQIHLSNLRPTAYQLTATPIGSQIKDTLCTRIAINQSNVKTAHDSLGMAQTLCWN